MESPSGINSSGAAGAPPSAALIPPPLTAFPPLLQIQNDEFQSGPEIALTTKTKNQLKQKDKT